ncbi:MAG: hypothetical protein HY049_07485 [Acidobacteria bacterium]|nr:hypothetical protein [Acidobacteriota bacterium]
MKLRNSVLAVACALSLMALTSSQTPATDTPPGNTPVGNGLVLQFPDANIKLVFGNVIVGGNTTITRTDLPPGVRLSPCGTPIPSRFNVPAGDNHFAVIRIETTAVFTDTVDTNSQSSDPNAHIFRAVCPPPKDAGWEDVTIIPVPGDPRSRIPGFSEFLIADDSLSNNTIIKNKINALIGLLGPGSDAEKYIDATTLSTLRNMVFSVNAAINAGDKPAAILGLKNFINFVLAGSGTTIPNNSNVPGGNIAGKLEAKASTLIFTLTLL